MKTYKVWLEGFKATGEEGTADYLGCFDGDNFKQACKNAIKYLGWSLELYNEKENSYWGCRFFKSEKKARKSFG